MILENELLNRLSSIEQHMASLGILNKEILTLNEAARYIDTSTSHIYKLTSSKQIPHYCPTGKKLYFKRSELDEWILKHKQTSVDEIQQQANDYVFTKTRRYQ